MQGSASGALVPSGSSSFLSTEQQKALADAIAAKQAEREAAAKHQHKALSVAQGDRKSRSSKGSGAAKKGGGGGKFTWGSILTNGDKVERVLDRNDPNYDSDEEREVVLQSQHQQVKEHVQSYKQAVAEIVSEYFSSGDIADVAESLEDLGVPGFMHYFIKRLITTALDRNNREREMASMLLSSLYAEVIPPEQVQKGFGSLVDSIDDLVLDVPDAPELLSLFITRAVVDDVLPPAIASRIPTTTPSTTLLKQKVEAQLSARHGAEKVLRCWGSGLTHQSTKESISKLLEEFLASGDAEEAARCLHALNVPFFHHEVVKQAVHRAMELLQAQPAQAQALVGLLVRTSSSGEISALQLRKGLARVSDSLDDLQLDNPHAKEQHAAVMQLVKDAGLMDMDEASALIARRLSSASITSTAGNGSTAAASGSPYAAHSVSAFKAAATAAVREYFDSSDIAEVGRRLHELQDPGMLHIFVKVAVVLSLDRRNRERELVSTLLASLHPEVMSDEAMSMGFTRLLAATDDLVLDCPDAVHLLSLFLGRAIVDEVLPPAFLTQVLDSMRSESLGINVVKSTGALLSARHGAERLTNAWKGGSLSLDQTRAEIATLLDEFIVSHDGAEASRCITELGMPQYNHEVVFKALELAFRNDKAAQDVTTLLAALSNTGVINQTQMTKGFTRMKARISEAALDFGATAAGVFERLSAAGVQQGWLVWDAAPGSTAADAAGHQNGSAKAQ